MVVGLALLLALGDPLQAPRVSACTSPTEPEAQLPGIVRGDDGVHYLSWVLHEEGTSRLRMSRLDAGAWSAPETLASGSDWFDNWADFPGLAALEDGTLLAYWLQKSSGATYSYDAMFQVRPADGPWTKPRALHTDESPSEHGFVSVVPHGERFAAIWLDGRGLSGSQHGEGSMALYQRTISRAGAPGPETLLDDRVCDCCSTSLVRTSEGLLAVYRDRSEDEVRDISYRLSSPERETRGGEVHADGWEIPGCPVNGPALAARGERAAVAWFTGVGAGGGNVLVSRWNGQAFGAPVDVDDGTPEGRVDLEFLGDGTLLVAWLENVGGAAQWRVRTLSATGEVSPSATLDRVPSERGSGHLRMAPRAQGVLAAWRSFEPPGISLALVDRP